MSHVTQIHLAIDIVRFGGAEYGQGFVSIHSHHNHNEGERHGRSQPNRALMESYDKAQSVQKVGHETKLDRLEAKGRLS
jgi:hypothetical protein